MSEHITTAEVLFDDSFVKPGPARFAFETRDTWANLKQDLWALMAGQHRTQHGVITQSSTLTNGVKSVLDALRIKPPKRFLDMPTPTKA